jgi:hypothetical protein
LTNSFFYEKNKILPSSSSATTSIINSSESNKKMIQENHFSLKNNFNLENGIYRDRSKFIAILEIENKQKINKYGKKNKTSIFLGRFDTEKEAQQALKRVCFFSILFNNDN